MIASSGADSRFNYTSNHMAERYAFPDEAPPTPTHDSIFIPSVAGT
jgi:hypothetical protein